MGAGLLANAVYQSTHPSLTHRIREQARSHILIFTWQWIWLNAKRLHSRIELAAEHQ